MSVYTKKGDKGTTSLYGSKKRISKSSPITEVLGAIDELNSFLGIVVTIGNNKSLIGELKRIQGNLFTINASIAGSPMTFYNQETLHLEKEIDKAESILPTLKNFIIPNGTAVSSHLMYSRAISRRAEREYTKLKRKNKNRANITRYLNRLSDYLFILARLANYNAKIKEDLWNASK